MAHNNHFFFEALTPDPAPMPVKVKEALEPSFSSIENLKREFIVTASSMFGPGFVWLVKAKDGKYSLLTTFLAGSPYPGAHYRRQAVDMNTEENAPAGVSDSLRRRIADPPTNRVGAFGPLSGETRMAPGGIDLTPVLCLNMWEHAYLPDYGVGAFGVGGKKAYAESWWHAIDWNVVADRADIKKARGASFYTG
jgi:Fe-Mn family superoxide dismutase